MTVQFKENRKTYKVKCFPASAAMNIKAGLLRQLPELAAMLARGGTGAAPWVVSPPQRLRQAPLGRGHLVALAMPGWRRPRCRRRYQWGARLATPGCRRFGCVAAVSAGRHGGAGLCGGERVARPCLRPPDPARTFAPSASACPRSPTRSCLHLSAHPPPAPTHPCLHIYTTHPCLPAS